MILHLERAIQGPFLFFFRNKFLCYNRKKGGAKVKEFLENIVKVFITLAILGPAIALVVIGLGIGALLF